MGLCWEVSNGIFSYFILVGERSWREADSEERWFAFLSVENVTANWNPKYVYMPLGYGSWNHAEWVRKGLGLSSAVV